MLRCYPTRLHFLFLFILHSLSNFFQRRFGEILESGGEPSHNFVNYFDGLQVIPEGHSMIQGT